MRPRSRLLAKKRLPTIREGHEELLQDMNQANSCHARGAACPPRTTCCPSASWPAPPSRCASRTATS
ncbi:hypothetical protein ANANG_G00072930 [Anguilla anguilla]|uniref:Uncharacterized protein n=1 Tax=Anguilla anguilla TaxID=7936 RepID=A0A9D3MV23_ANGAN|nr:hypothetical protein ANANG_G00072930 [Anguilla anguilla]